MKRVPRTGKKQIEYPQTQLGGDCTPRILIIDDDEATRGVIRERLEDAYEIIETGDAKQAIALALQHKPDVVLLDLMMPEFSGFEVCQTLSSLSFTQQIPILIISGELAIKYQTFCQNLGAAGYFEKPINFDHLKSRLTALLQVQKPERRAGPRVRLNVILKLKGTDKAGNPFELFTTTENVSTDGFLCNCAVALANDATVEVFLSREGEPHAGTARTVRVQGRDTPCPRYGFHFVKKPSKWILE